MAFTEFVCRSGGSNMNGGSLASNAEPATTPVYSFTNGGWDSTTGIYTPTSGNPSATVTVGDFAHVFADGTTVPKFIARVTAVSTTTVTVSLVAKGGVAPTTAGTGTSINVGGAWLGPNAAVAFPFGFAAAAMTNASSDTIRVNFKNNQQYNITAAMSHNVAGPSIFQGYTTSFGDLGKATIDGGTTGASFAMLTTTGGGGTHVNLVDLIFQNNGATGSASGIVINSTNVLALRVVVHDILGDGFSFAQHLVECEAYACNKSNTANMSGMTASNQCNMTRCISHDNVGSNNNGFYSASSNVNYIDCIADSNGQHGFFLNSVNRVTMYGCESYNNVGDGLREVTQFVDVDIQNCNFVKNGGFGFNVFAGSNGILANCGFVDNTGGDKQNVSRIFETGTVSYGTGTTPWVDPANGDFRINLPAAINTGRGNYTQTAASYAGTIGYPDIGAAQHLEIARPVGQLKQFNRGSPY